MSALTSAIQIHKYSQALEDVSGVMSFDLDLYLHGHSVMILQQILPEILHTIRHVSFQLKS